MTPKYIPAKAVRTMCGEVSDMSLWRWMHNAALAFPKPVYINRRRYWSEADIAAWLASRAADSEAA